MQEKCYNTQWGGGANGKDKKGTKKWSYLAAEENERASRKTNRCLEDVAVPKPALSLPVSIQALSICGH